MGQTIHFVRHGEVYNPEKILYGLQPGWRLSDRGLEMAHAVAEWSKTLNLGAIWSRRLSWKMGRSSSCLVGQPDNIRP